MNYSNNLCIFVIYKNNIMPTVLITGAAGFIGFHLCTVFTENNYVVYALDNLQNSTEPDLKLDRLTSLGINTKLIKYGEIIAAGSLNFIQCDLNDTLTLNKFFTANHFDVVVHLAAQTGVRNSVNNPDIYIKNNIIGFQNVLQTCKNFNINKLIFASSSSVYGENRKMPYLEDFPTDNPESIYAVTKKSNELMAQAYSNLFKINAIGLRFFTVYGPWVRTDMASYIFMKSISEEKPINFYNSGHSLRDFTFVDDVVKSIFLIAKKITGPDAHSYPLFNIYNVGNSHPVNLEKFLNCIELFLNKKADIHNKPIQEGDVTATFACVDKLNQFIQFKPDTDIETGVKKMVDWFTKFHHK